MQPMRIYMSMYVVYIDLRLCGVCGCACVYVWCMHVGVVYVGAYVCGVCVNMCTCAACVYGVCGYANVWCMCCMFKHVCMCCMYVWCTWVCMRVWCMCVRMCMQAHWSVHGQGQRSVLSVSLYHFPSYCFSLLKNIVF